MFPPCTDDVYELHNFPHFKSLVDANSGGSGGSGGNNDRDGGVGGEAGVVGSTPDRTLVVLAGDFLAPSLLSSLDKGRGMVDCMNACGITHVCFGNHEADVPTPQLALRIAVDSRFQWINTNMRELDAKLDVETLPHDVIEVTSSCARGADDDTTALTKRVGLLGLLTDDPSVYRPGVFAGAKIEPVIETTERYLEEVMKPLNLDLVIPLTHQRMNEERDFMRKFKGDNFPIIIGGHDHERYDETIEGSRAVKTGMDGEYTAIIDVVWRDAAGPSKPEITVDMMRTDSYPPDPKLVKLVQGHERVLHELHRAKIFRFRDWLLGGPDERFSTKNNRLGPSNGTTIFANMFRMGMRAECCMLNAGNIRGGNTYPPDQEWFTWSDLKAEIPYSVGMGAVKLPGRVLEETINHSRSFFRLVPPVASGGFIHVCDNIEFDEEQRRVVSIKGEPFDPDRLYLTAFPTNWFEGMDDHKPLVDWAKGTPYEHAKESSSKPAKEVIVELFSALLWLKLGSFDAIDANGDGVLTRDEVRARAIAVFGDDVADFVVDNVFSVADIDGDGVITPLDMMIVKFVASDMVHHVTTDEECEVLQKVAASTLSARLSDASVLDSVESMVAALDPNNDGKITRQESMEILGELKRRSLLM
jgi:5'-nucleotidase